MGLDESKREMFIRDLTSKHKKLFEGSFVELKKEILKYEPKHFLSLFSFYYLTNDISDSMPHSSDGYKITQYHIEFFQALVLQHGHEDFDNKLLNMQDHIKFCDLAVNIALSSQLRDFDKSIGKSDSEQSRDGIIHAIRGHTMECRNFAYPHQILRVSKELFSVLDNDFEILTGVTLSGLIDMLVGIRDKVSSSIIDFFKGLMNNSDNFIFDEYEKRITDTYILTLDDICKCYPTLIDPCILKQTLDKWAFRFGDLKETDENFSSKQSDMDKTIH